MKSLTQYINEQMMINERFLNAFEKDDMRKYADEVWKIVQKSYEYCGGIAGYNNAEDLIADTDMWKMIRRNGKITAAKIYKFKDGYRKCTCVATDGTEQGKADITKMYIEDAMLKDRKVYGEYSERAVSKALNTGGIPVPAEIAKTILKGKEVIPCEDGWFYERTLGDGKSHKKLMIGEIPAKNKEEQPSKELITVLKELAKQYSEHHHDEKTKDDSSQKE